MERKYYTALFAVVMMVMLAPFAPAYIKDRLDTDLSGDDFSVIPTTHAATKPQDVYGYISAGYIGNYGISATPRQETAQVLGTANFRSAAEISQPYQALELGRSEYVVNLESGRGYTFWIDFLNTGTATWYNHGDQYLAVNLTEPAGRDSPFEHEFWVSSYQPGKLLQDEVKPGEIGRFRFALQAPGTTGGYIEKFNLVAENTAWVEGGYFEIHIGVNKKAHRPYDYEAREVERSKGGVVTVDPGQAITFWVDFENVGLKNWYRSYGNFVALNVTNPTGRVSQFKHDFWNEHYYRPARLSQSRIYPGEIGRFRFALQAPSVEGYYTESFALVAENYSFIKGGEFSITIKVGDPPQPTPANQTISGEPNVRIGLFQAEDTVSLTANGAYTVYNLTTDTQRNKQAGETSTAVFAEDTYKRFVPKNSQTIMEITSYENHPSWKSSLNDNTFRGTIEVRYSETTGEMWVINELGVESYLKGLAEVANEQPVEYLKSLIIAARSYVLWHELRGGKHPDNYFDINAVTDQVYRGYGFEQRSEDPLQAVTATAGQVITHPDAVSQLNPDGIAIAAYSSGTDGRTRSWNEVWAGSGFPWLVSVDDPYGKISNWNTLEGNHMVGMSAQGARGYATKENKTYDWILRHYYTGTTVEKIY